MTSETTVPTSPTGETASPVVHPQWCDRQTCDIRYDRAWSDEGDGWVGYHSTRRVQLDLGEQGLGWVAVQQFRDGAEGTDPARVVMRVDDMHANPEQAAELARVLNEHAALLDRAN